MKKMQTGGSSTPVQFDMTNRELRKFRKETKKSSKEAAKGAMKKMQKGGSAKVTVRTVSPNDPYEKRKAELAEKLAKVEAEYRTKMKTATAKLKAEKSANKAKLPKKAMGGSAEIVGMPQYGNNPRTYSGAMLKSGGSIKKMAAKRK